MSILYCIGNKKLLETLIMCCTVEYPKLSHKLGKTDQRFLSMSYASALPTRKSKAKIERILAKETKLQKKKSANKGKFYLMTLNILEPQMCLKMDRIKHV